MILQASTSPIRRIENPSWLTLPATRGLTRPPTRTQLQLLPFQELEWEDFERLCYRLARIRGDVEQWAALYGARGQKQDGIDIYVREPSAKLYSCWQSKRYRQLTPARLRATIAEFEKGGCRAKLLDIARLEKVERLDFLISGFARLGVSPDDAEVMDTILKHDFSRRGIFDATDRLISGFGTHPTVRSIALERLKELDAPWEVLIQTYASDEEIRTIIARYLSSLPASLRSVLVSSLGRRAMDNNALAKHLLQYRLDSQSAVRTASAIAYFEAIAADENARSAAIAQLKNDAAAIGPWMDMIRQAALAGFIALGELSVFADLPDWQPEKKLSLDVFTFDNNRQILTYIAKHWDRLTSALGPHLFERLSRHANEWWCWDHLSPYISKSPSLRADFLAYCSHETKLLSNRAIEALARESPKSHLLREHCLRCLTDRPQDINASAFDSRRREFIVGRILARQFAGEVATPK